MLDEFSPSSFNGSPDVSGRLQIAGSSALHRSSNHSRPRLHSQAAFDRSQADAALTSLRTPRSNHVEEMFRVRQGKHSPVPPRICALGALPLLLALQHHPLVLSVAVGLGKFPRHCPLAGQRHRYAVAPDSVSVRRLFSGCGKLRRPHPGAHRRDQWRGAVWRRLSAPSSLAVGQ